MEQLAALAWPDRAAKILVVDDNAANRSAVLKLLALEGYTVVEAVDGTDGLRAALLERPELVISDILMPSMDGYEFVRRLRANPVLASTAVIFYTANYHGREAENLAAQCGVSRVILKPCGAKQFLSTVSEVLTTTSEPAPPTLDDEFDRRHLLAVSETLSQKSDQLALLSNRFAALNELNVQLASERDPSILLSRVCAGARSLLGAKYSVLAVADRSDAPTTALKTWTGGLALPNDALTGLSLHAGLPGQACKLQKAVRVSRISCATEIGLPAGFPAVCSALAAPILATTQCFGWLLLADKLGAEEFDATDERMLGTLGALVGRIYESGQLYLDMQEQSAHLLIEMEERERAAVHLRESEERFRQMAENIQDVFFVCSKDLTKLTYVSPAYRRIWGEESQRAPHDVNAWLQTVHPADRERVSRAHELTARSWPATSEIEYRIVRTGAPIRWLLERLFPITDESGEVQRAVGIATDITQRKQSEARIVQLSRVHAMLSGINSLIVRVRDRDELVREACRLAVEEGGFRVAWCALIDPATHAPRCVASSGESRGIPELLTEALSAGIGSDNIVARVMHNQRAEIHDDLRHAEVQGPVPAALIEAGYRGAAVYPLTTDGVAVGCLALITDESNTLDEAETHLLAELAGDISFALDHIQKAERLDYLAYYDSLTGLANRALFTDRLSTHAAAAARSGSRLAVVVVEPDRLDGFTQVLLRSTADELLRKVAERFVHCVGAPDLTARIGSDHFAAIIPDLASDYGLETTLERWWREWPGSAFEVDGQEIAISVKAGIALLPNDGTSAETLLRNAQAALKTAKNSPARHVFYTTNLSERLTERMTLESQIRRALENEEFVLHYQPKVDMAQRRVVGVEALMRWQSPQLGLVSPAKFIPIMEETGLIVEAGAWAMRQACLDRSRWLEKHLKAPRIAVNVSAVQLRQSDFVRTVSTILKLAGSEAGMDIEVTESLLLEGAAENVEKLKAIRDLGVHIALDDFGTGYSSLSYLTKLPVETIKIDRGFVIPMLDDPSATALVSTIISLARTLRLETVAEGVESEEQAKILRLLQCDQMQGYLISKPLSFDEMTAYLGGRKPAQTRRT